MFKEHGRRPASVPLEQESGISVAPLTDGKPTRAPAGRDAGALQSDSQRTGRTCRASERALGRDRGSRGIAILSVGLVVAVAAIVSYSHMEDVAARAGEGWRAWIEPLSVDGLLVGASQVVARRPRAWLEWLAVLVGLLVSLGEVPPG